MSASRTVLMIRVHVTVAGHAQDMSSAAHATLHGTVNTVIETRQECGHTLYWRNLNHAPKPGERIWCEHDNCKDMRVVESRTGTWFARCRNCAWHRALQDVHKLTEKVAAHIREREHVVDVWNHDRTEHATARTPHAARQAVTDDAPSGQKSKNGSRTAPQQPRNTLF